MADIDDIKTLIKASTGYEVPSDDDDLLEYLRGAEVQHVLNFCNLSTLPDELTAEVNRVTAAQYLLARKPTVLSGDLDVVTSIEEGDTKVELGGTSAEERLDSLIAEWSKERDLTCFRKLRW